MFWGSMIFIKLLIKSNNCTIYSNFLYLELIRGLNRFLFHYYWTVSIILYKTNKTTTVHGILVFYSNMKTTLRMSFTASFPVWWYKFKRYYEMFHVHRPGLSIYVLHSWSEQPSNWSNIVSTIFQNGAQKNGCHSYAVTACQTIICSYK